ncbi:MAG: crotonase/enoyl-CoA hydratase family protein [Acidimicrobiia bacterium]|nr:crotonase/enoyl-CoA hydratase family protein [Acidimicrobiia bacterium]
MSFETIELKVDDSVATLTLNRPDRLNAFNPTMLRELVAVCDQIDTDDGIRAVIVTGAGRAFCAGADLERGGDTFDADVRRKDPDDAGGSGEVRRDGGGQVALRLFALNKPIIAAINGAAVGVGVTMTLPMDIRLLAESAKIGFVFARRGIAPEACSSWFLPRLVGIPKAAEWCYSGRVFPAAEAAAGGLGELVADDRLLERAQELASDFARSAPVSVALIRQMLWRGLTFDHPMEAHRVDSRAIQALGRLADAKEGVTSFLEKRPAEWSLRPSRDLPDIFPGWTDPPFS